MSSKVINNNESINLKKGYLYVKLPLNLGTFVGQYKFWSKKWVQIECKNSQNEDNFVDILISKNKKCEHVIIYRTSFRSGNTAIFRSRSRTQCYSFTICDNNVALIHMSTNSETESQVWMQFLRNNMWPPDPLMEFENSIKGHFYASIIDNENSHRSGLLGAYGYLQLSNANLVLTHPQTGHVIQEWLLFKHILKNPFDNVLKVINRSSGSSGIQNIFIYCEDAKQIMERIKQRNLENKVNCRHELEKLSNGCNSSSVVNKRFEQSVDRKNLYPIISNDIDCHTFRIRSLTEIPESMLNTSLSSNNFETKNNENIYSEPTEPLDYIESDIYEEIDRIYEEIVDREDNNSLSDFCTNYSNLRQKSDPIEIKTKFQSNININDNKEENSMFGYDMFSQIVKRTNIPLIDSKLSIKRTKPSENVSKGSDNDYYEMRPIFNRKKAEGKYSSDNCDYVYMQSFSI